MRRGEEECGREGGREGNKEGGRGGRREEAKEGGRGGISTNQQASKQLYWRRPQKNEYIVVSY